MPQRDLRQALLDDLEQIEDNAALYHAGRNSAYQTVAIQLRNLLLGGERGLLLRVLPGATMHLLRPPQITEPDGPKVVTALYFDPRGSVRLGGVPGGAQLNLDFTEQVVAVGEWLDQWIYTPEVTLRGLIGATANEEVAHTEGEIAAAIEAANTMKFSGRRVQGRQLHAMAIVALGDYVVLRTRIMLAGK